MTAHSPISVLSFSVDPFAEEDYAPVDTEKVISGTPRQAFRVLYTSASEDFCTGIYACTPGSGGFPIRKTSFAPSPAAPLYSPMLMAMWRSVSMRPIVF